ncbi:hypothetical protein [Micromonospora sp. URMC 103]|uniref:hypothetical protein n=1 Tax=Micromonospora sp. URMC 103 TaxID=3423406 RepID=UPI003F1A89AE
MAEGLLEPSGQPIGSDQPMEGQRLEPTPSSNDVQKSRAIAGLLAVAIGDATIIAAAIVGLIVMDSASAEAQSVAILTSAFAAIGTMTTAYFGIRAATNTAQSSISGRKTD